MQKQKNKLNRMAKRGTTNKKKKKKNKNTHQPTKMREKKRGKKKNKKKSKQNKVEGIFFVLEAFLLFQFRDPLLGAGAQLLQGPAGSGVAPWFGGWKNRTPATNIILFCLSGKQRGSPEKLKKEKRGANSGEGLVKFALRNTHKTSTSSSGGWKLGTPKPIYST